MKIFFLSIYIDFALNFIKDYTNDKFTILNLLNKEKVLKNIKHYYVKLRSKYDRFRALLSLLERIKYNKVKF